MMESAKDKTENIIQKGKEQLQPKLE